VRIEYSNKYNTDSTLSTSGIFG